MAALMRVEFTFPSNWCYEGTVDLLYVDPGTNMETSYGVLAQNTTRVQETYEGHCWLLREQASRELLMSIVARRPPAGQDAQHVTVRSDSADPVRAALWRMGQAAREPLLKACGLLLKILANISDNPNEPKFRNIKCSNVAMVAALDIPGVLSLLSHLGFEQSLVDGDARMILSPEGGMQAVRDALGQLRRLDALLRGLPPPSESLSSMQATQAAQNAAQASSSHATPSHQCSACGCGIENDLRRKLAGSGEIGGWRTHDFAGGGEYRFHCSTCDKDLCSKCYDQWKAGAPTHPQHCQARALIVITPPSPYLTVPYQRRIYCTAPHTDRDHRADHQLLGWYIIWCDAASTTGHFTQPPRSLGLMQG